VLEVEQVLHVPGQRNHPDIEVRALEVGHGPKALLPYRVLLILNWEKRDRQCCYSGEAVLTQGGEAMCAIISTLVSGSL
jgi:phage-related protein